ncbi:MAG: universal stress protein [Nitrososphaerales archaeon]
MSSPREKLGIRRIVVAVDGSENAMRAVKVASEIAKNNEAELTILHVIALPSGVYYGDVPISIEKVEGDARRKAEKFIAMGMSLAEEMGTKAKTVVIEKVDSPGKGITEYADKSLADLIVVGTRGLGTFRRLLLGSVASCVVQYAHCSVMVVR